MTPPPAFLFLCRAACAMAVLASWLPLAAHAAAAPVQVLDARGRPLADAVVYATPAGAKPAAAAPGATAAIDQIDREFVPLVSVIQTGTNVRFPNKDDVEHDIYSFSPAKRFEIKLYSGVPSKPVLFDKPGLVVLGCNIHDSMVAYVLVVETPYFGRTDKDGRFSFENLPAGSYRVAVWHYRMRDPNAQPTSTAQVAAGGASPALKFTLTTEGN
ncbi:methylamine utilization protein [Xylophilus ampelinus]|nr:methylamine utilization protein [Xylophilus ampelinus]MCS4511292.1 methylamine utilization protein [Xylophilus ampelinus]